MRTALAILVLALGGTGAAAQQAECEGGVAAAATAPTPGDATAPGNAATGWSGGLGGSQTGTSPHGAVAESKTWQPPTARGLDLAGEPEPAAC
ncbi:hypothetical protein [Amaricoccus sp.]|uniref:hypothetical protein n=1 Tax=Amaricoccus sp. TaxID=1872485 RepID=UPI001B6C5178|nr:hypothetical protein [Amaricoccus sp.]MBP7001762.1 hypothetical protein [Amaricoccus sp.]